MSQEKKRSIRDAVTVYLKSQKLPYDDEQLLKVLEDYREAWTRERRQTVETGWRNNAAFYSGNHHIRDGGSSGSYRVRLRENHINNSINRMLSIFMQNLPIVRAFPMSIDSEDLNDARATEMYYKYFWRMKKLEMRYQKLIKYSAICGNAFTLRTWNAEAGGKIELDPHETKSGDREVRFYHGEPDLIVDDPFKIAVRPGIDELDDMYDFIRSEPVNRAMVETEHGEVKAESARGLDAYTGQMRSDPDLIMRHHYYHQPMPWFEEGLYICWVPGKVLKIRNANESEKRLPIGHLHFDKPMMRFYGMASIDQAIDLQEQLNRASSMIVEARNLVARPRVLAAEEAKVAGQSISDRPGDIIRYKLAGGPPKFEVPSFNFGEMQAHKADLRDALNQVMGITSASRGEIPSATRTALALQMVLEQDRSQFLPFIKQYHQIMLDDAMGILSVAAEFIPEDDPRMAKIEGTELSKPFHGGMVPSPLDMYLEDTNPLGWTSGSRIEQVGVLIDKDLVKDRTQALEMLGLSSTDPAMQVINIHRQAQDLENEELLKGVVLEIGPEDDDEIHLERMERIMASYSFRKKPPAVRDAFMAHAEAHKARLMQGMQQQGAPNAGGMKQGSVDPAQMGAAMQAPVPGAPDAGRKQALSTAPM